jgi:AhpD family alkylhydroperoxidase
MKERIDYQKFAHEALHSLLAIERYLAASGIDPKLLHLIKLRASQINGCAYCIDMHSKDARAAGETEQRLYELNAWGETPFYSERERAALEWTEALTLISQTHAPDDVFERVSAQFSEKEIVDLTYAIASINTWNRIAIAFRAVPGTYQPAKKDRRRFLASAVFRASRNNPGRSSSHNFFQERQWSFFSSCLVPCFSFARSAHWVFPCSTVGLPPAALPWRPCSSSPVPPISINSAMIWHA